MVKWQQTNLLPMRKEAESAVIHTHMFSVPQVSILALSQAINRHRVQILGINFLEILVSNLKGREALRVTVINLLFLPSH